MPTGRHEDENHMIARRKARDARPTASITPEASWPSATGMSRGRSPLITDRSEWHSPAAAIFTRTSPKTRLLQIGLDDFERLRVLIGTRRSLGSQQGYSGFHVTLPLGTLMSNRLLPRPDGYPIALRSRQVNSRRGRRLSFGTLHVYESSYEAVKTAPSHVEYRARANDPLTQAPSPFSACSP